MATNGNSEPICLLVSVTVLALTADNLSILAYF